MYLSLVREVFADHPAFTDDVFFRLGALADLVVQWNDRVNLISRKDVENLEVRHMLHSLMIAKAWQPNPGALVADVGSGGGFPGLPLAVVFPEVRFTLIDSVAKKGAAAAEIAQKLGLDNVRIISKRAEKVPERFDYITGRAVAALPKFINWITPLVRKGQAGNLPNGLLYFKGTLWREELAGSACQPGQIWNLADYSSNEYFAEKFLLHFEFPSLKQLES